MAAAACRRCSRWSPASWRSASNLLMSGGRSPFRLIHQWNEGGGEVWRLSGSRQSAPSWIMQAAASAAITVDCSDCSGTFSTTSCNFHRSRVTCGRRNTLSLIGSASSTPVHGLKGRRHGAPGRACRRPLRPVATLLMAERIKGSECWAAERPPS